MSDVHTHADGTTHSHDHSHPHTHEHTHADGTTHTHEHHHDADHHHTHDHSGTPREELIAMLRYMTGHNAAHVKETAELAESLGEDQEEIRSAIDEAVRLFEEGNAELMIALTALEDQKEA